MQDLRSNVYALDRADGTLRWARRYHALNDGPNGLAVDDRRVYGATDSDASRSRCHRPRALAPSPHERARAVRQHRAGRLERPCLREHRRLRAFWTRSDLRARRGDGRRALEVRNDREAVALSTRGGRRRALVSGFGGRKRQALRRQLESVPVGRLARAAERCRIPGAGPLHRLADRARRAHRQAALVRPGYAARRPRLRLPGVADPREGRWRPTSSSAEARRGG